LARRLLLLATRIARGAIEVALELTELALERVLPLVDAIGLLRARLRARRQLLHLIDDLLLLARQRIGLTLGVLDVALRALRHRSLQLLFRLAQTLERSLCLRRRVGIAAGRGAAHRIRGFAHLPRGFLQLGPLLFARQTLEPTGRL